MHAGSAGAHTQRKGCLQTVKPLTTHFFAKKRIKRQAEEKHAEEAEQRSALAKRKGAIKAQKEEAEKYQQCQKEQVL